MPRKKKVHTYYKYGAAAGRYFTPSANCSRCGKQNVPCSNLADEWNCADCFEKAALKITGSNRTVDSINYPANDGSIDGIVQTKGQRAI